MSAPSRQPSRLNSSMMAFSRARELGLSTVPPAERTIEMQKAAADMKYEFVSSRSKSVHRLAFELHISLQFLTIEHTFHFFRFQLRYDKLLNTKSDSLDSDAMSAGSDQDLVMIQMVGECFQKCGFAILRALSYIREFGSPMAKQMGLYCILSTSQTCQDFIALTNLIYLESKVNSRKDFKAEVVLKLKSNTQMEILQRFADLRLIMPSDIVHRNSSIHEVHELLDNNAVAQLKISYDFEAITAALLNGKPWPHLLSFARLLKQASFASEKDVNQTDSSEWINKLISMEFNPKASTRSPITMELVFDQGSTLYRACKEITQSLATVMHDINPDDMFQILQAPLVRRMQFIEAVHLQESLHSVFAKGSDARVTVLHRVSGLLQADLDSLVEDLTKNERL